MDIEDNVNKIMITQKISQPTYLLYKDPELRLWHCRFAHASNTRIVHVFKLVDEMKLSASDTGNSNDDWFSWDSKIDDGKRSESDVFNPASLNKIIKSIKYLCDMYIESKHTRIVKHKAITPIV